MAQITNASSVWVSTGGGTPFEIYDKKNTPYKDSFNGTELINDSQKAHNIYFFDNGDGTMRMVGVYPFDLSRNNNPIVLPNGYVFNGNQTISTYGYTYNQWNTILFGEVSAFYPTTVKDGQQSFVPQTMDGGAYDTIINVRKQ